MKALEYFLIAVIGLAGAYVVATAAGRFIEKSFTDAAQRLEQMR